MEAHQTDDGGAPAGARSGQGARPELKRKLLETLRASREREADLEAAALDAPADPNGRWSAKDHLAHLSWWREHNAARTIEAIRTDTAPPPRVEEDLQNAEIYAATKDLRASEIKKEAKSSWAALEGAVNACAEDDLTKPHPDASGFKLWEIIPAHAGHIGTHLMWWHLENGDVKSAEAAAGWAYEVESEAFPEPDKRVDATYNLACFYSRAGRVDEAVSLLRQSFNAKPDLVSLARRDPDLHPIRDRAEFKALLAT